MIRYLGHKPFNWPASILVFGWTGLSLIAFLGPNIAELSFFHSGLPPGALMWRPEMGFVGLVLLMSPLALGALACWLVPATDHSRVIGAVLVGAGVAAFSAGLALEAGAGVAVYPDRIVYRKSGFLAGYQVERFADIRRVEAACSSYRRRRSSLQINPIYNVVFASGYSVDVWRGSGTRSLDQRTSTLEIVRLIDRQARAVGAVRAPARKPDGALIGSPGCLDRLAERLSIRRSELEGLFEVHQSELKQHEYAIRPTNP